MNDMKKTKEGVNLKKKKFLRLKNTGSILVLMGLLIIFVIALYTFILQSSYTKTALDTEIARDTASADAVHKLVDGRISKEDFDQIKDQSDEKKQIYKDISSYFNEIRTLNSTRYIYTAKKNEEGKLVYVVDGLDPDADDVRHPGDYIEEEMVPYIDILMDIMMPNMDGHQATKAIRALGIERSDAVTIPIIALSANAFIDDIQESLDSGMNDHISKPINMEEVTDTIAKYIKDDTCLEKELKQKQNDR